MHANGLLIGRSWDSIHSNKHWFCTFLLIILAYLTKYILQAEGKQTKSREEYKQYIEKYTKVRDEFEEKMVKSARAFQAQDHAHLNSMKKLIATYAKHVEECQSAASQVQTKLGLPPGPAGTPWNSIHPDEWL